MRRTPTVSVVVPALNEEESVDWVIAAIPPWVSEVILVDGLSTDGTELVVADRRHDVVIVHQRARGVGAALRAGFAAASGDIVVVVAADGSLNPLEMNRYVQALADGADVVQGSRNLPGGRSAESSSVRRFANRGLLRAANVLFGVRFSDLGYGYCAFWRRHLDVLALTADGSQLCLQLVFSAVKADLNVCEVPSVELKRRVSHGERNTWTDARRMLRVLLSERRSKPNRPRGENAQVVLSTVELAAHDTDQWVPAGSDRRDHLAGDRRVGVEPSGEADGGDRRYGQRRSRPQRTTRILYAHTASEAVASPRAPGRYRLQVGADPPRTPTVADDDVVGD